MANCTMPHAFGFHAWFEAKFGDLCARHDEAYSNGENRKQADLSLAAGIMVRGYPALAFITYMFVRSAGLLHYKRVI